MSSGQAGMVCLLDLFVSGTWCAHECYESSPLASPHQFLHSVGTGGHSGPCSSSLSTGKHQPSSESLTRHSHMRKNHNSHCFQSCHSLCFPTIAPTNDSFSCGSVGLSMVSLLSPLPRSNHPLQETRRPWNHYSFYHPVLLKVVLNQGAPAGGLTTSRVMLRAPCRPGLAVACQECALLGVSTASYQPGSSSPAPTHSVSCPASPGPLSTQTLSQRASCAPYQATCPKGSWSPGCCNRSPLGTPCMGCLQQSCAQALLWRVCLALLAACPIVVCCLFVSSTILLRFLTFKPICQLLLSVLTGSCWLNP